MLLHAQKYQSICPLCETEDGRFGIPCSIGNTTCIPLPTKRTPEGERVIDWDRVGGKINVLFIFPDGTEKVFVPKDTTLEPFLDAALIREVRKFLSSESNLDPDVHQPPTTISFETGGEVSTTYPPDPRKSLKDCDCPWGNVKVVASGADFRIKKEYSGCTVWVVDRTPARCGEWKFVDSWEDFTIEFVDSFADFTIDLRE